LPEPWAAAEQPLAPRSALRLAQWQSLYEWFGDLRNARGPDGQPLHLLAALSHQTRATLAQTSVPDKTNASTSLRRPQSPGLAPHDPTLAWRGPAREIASSVKWPCRPLHLARKKP